MKYVIHSKSERGFWNSNLGWVYQITKATKFPARNYYLPVTALMDAEWIVYCYDE